MLTGKRIQLTPFQAWTEGTNLRKAVRAFPEEVRAYVVKEVASLCKEMDMKKSIASDEEMQFVCRTIIEDFPAMKLEELRLAFDNIRKGRVDLYERLKGPEILKALYDYEGDVRAPLLEDLHAKQKKAEQSLHKLEWFKRAGQWVAEQPNEPEKPTIKEGIGSRLRKKMQ